MPHFDLLIRNGTAVLPWGEAAADIGVREGRIAGEVGGDGSAITQERIIAIATGALEQVAA